jgi:hypothetical protein
MELPNTSDSGNSAETEFTLAEGVVDEVEEGDGLNTAFIDREEESNSEEEEVVFSDNDGKGNESNNSNKSYSSNSASDNNQTMSYDEEPAGPTLLKLGDIEIELADDENKTTTIV